MTRIPTRRTERPILFSTPMIAAIKGGTKYHTRRICKHQTADSNPVDFIDSCPYGKPGDRLWVREAFLPCKDLGVPCKISEASFVCYRDGDQKYDSGEYFQWRPTSSPDWTKYQFRPSIHMPRWASRFSLKIWGVCCERVQNITEADAFAEGFVPKDGSTARAEFQTLWNKINGPGSWVLNPLVWVVTFEVDT